VTSPETPLTARQSGPVQGRARVPGDKSISHRALILGALTVGETTVAGLLEGEDVLHTAEVMRALGAGVERGDDQVWRETFSISAIPVPAAG
jgi:3-phosphoshikimate 1-carboxyvinyltransferase